MKQITALNSIKDIEKLESIGLSIDFDPQEEDISPFDMFDEKETAKEVCERYESIGLPAWFCAKVTVKYRDFEADDYLGCCSYNSFKEFTTAENDYYVDMINACISEINKDIESHNQEVKKWFDIRTAKNLLKPYGLKVVETTEIKEISY